jgi:large conductance mechanosensitive channel
MLGTVVKKIGSTPAPSGPTTKECPECLSVIPIKATRCAYCTAKLPPVA